MQIDKWFCVIDETSNPAATPTPKEKKRPLVVDLCSDSSDDEDKTPTQSAPKKRANSPLLKSQTSAISSTSDSPELLIIDIA